jgi:hypothetical protein
MIIYQTKNPEVNFDFTNATNFQIFESNDTTSTTVTYPSYNIKLQGTTSTPSSGYFILNFFFEMTSSTANTSNWYRVDYKPTSSGTWNILSECQVRVPQGENYLPISGFRIFQINSSDTIDFRVSHARSSGTTSGTNRIRNVNVYIFKVAS